MVPVQCKIAVSVLMSLCAADKLHTCRAYRAFFGTDDKQRLLLLLQMNTLSDSSLPVHIMVVWEDTPVCSCCQGFCPRLASPLLMGCFSSHSKQGQATKVTQAAKANVPAQLRASTI